MISSPENQADPTVEPGLTVPSPGFPPFPLLASTQFCMDVLLRGAVLDLSSVVEVLHVDPCAVLRILASVGEEVAHTGEQPERLQDCIAMLGRAGLVRALVPSPSTWTQQSRLSAFAEHGVAIGRAAQIGAGGLGTCAESAYLRGVLHEIADLPRQLGWSDRLGELTPLAWATAIATQYRLPPALRHDLLSLHASDSRALWPQLIMAAHELTGTLDPSGQRESHHLPAFSSFSHREV